MSNNLDLSQIAATQPNKHTTANDQVAEIDAAFTEPLECDVSAGNVTVTPAQYRRAIWFYATGAATNARTVTLQAIRRLAMLANFSTTHSVDFVLGSATVTVGPAADAATPTAALVYTDGTADGLYSIAGSLALEDLEGIALSTPAQGQMLRFDSALDLVNEDAPYDLVFFLPGVYSDGALMAQVVFDRSVTFPDGLASSQGYAGVTATAETVLDVHKNGSPIGTITFGSGSSTASLAMTGAQSFAAGDRLSIVNEDPADDTLADLSITLRGKRN